MSQISEKVLATSIQYLGPAAKMFLERQTKYHLDGLAFDDLQPAHLPELAKWVNTSAGLIIDKTRAQELSEKIAKTR